MPSLNTKLATAANTSANYVLKATSSTTIGNSNITDNGIAITNVNPYAGQYAWQFNGNSGTGTSYGALVVAGTNSSDVSFKVQNISGTEYFRVRGDGNVGIGNSSPSYTLDVTGTGRFTDTITSSVTGYTSIMLNCALGVPAGIRWYDTDDLGQVVIAGGYNGSEIGRAHV